MNLLILSCGTRNKIIQYFRNTVAGKGIVIATDCNDLAPALYDADKFYIVPPITDENYFDAILNICLKDKVDGVLSLIDPELSLLSKEEMKFLAINTKVVSSNYKVCERSLDKWQMYLWLTKNGFSCAKTFIEYKSFVQAQQEKSIDFPVIVKPIKGSASIAIQKVFDIKMLEYLVINSKNIIIQEYLNGSEIGVDCYVDLISKKVVSIFAKKKILMRAGETDKAVSFKCTALFDFVVQFVEKCGYVGPIDIDLFEIKGSYYVSEVNPRFGGGYPHAFESGVNFMKLIQNNLQGIINKNTIGEYDRGIIMMKYNEVIIRHPCFIRDG
jgi:carbamoyl-phosphate synthase large subunit